MMIHSRRMAWIAASTFIAVFLILATTSNVNVNANITTRQLYHQSKYKNLSAARTFTQQQQQQPPLEKTLHKKQSPQSILVGAMARQVEEMLEKVIIKTRTNQLPPDGIYVNKPVLRGQFHKWGAILFPPLMGLPLCLKASRAAASTNSNASGSLLKTALLFCFGAELIMTISGTLHTYKWKTEKAHQRARKLDFTGIFVGIACFYSSLGRLVMGSHPLWNPIEQIVWACAILGTLLKWKVPDAPHWANASIFLVQGWASLPLVPFLLFSDAVSTKTAVSVLAGATFVTLGALAYSLQWPFNTARKQPFEIVFGPHEMFHVGTLFMFVSFTVTMWTRITELTSY